MSGLQRMKLNALNIDANNSFVIGIIIAKSSPRIFKSKKNPEESRGVWSFTLRDSPVDFINCIVWGSPYFVTSFDEMFHVGDVVNILTPRVKTRQLDDRNEQFVPQVSSPFQLILNERQSEMTIHESDDFSKYIPLLHIPSKAAASYFTLADVNNNTKNIREEMVDLLVAVRSLFPIRMVKTKLGEEIPHREIAVMDQSTTAPLKIMIWDAETIKRSESWQSRETILFMSDIKLEWSDFNKCIVGRINGRTIITIDPHTPEAESLRVYARHVPLKKTAVLEQISHDIPDPNSIRSVMTVQQVKDRANSKEHVQFTALMYVVVTQIDLDGPSKLIVTKCGACSGFLKAPQYLCEKITCPSMGGNEVYENDVSFDIKVTLTDHTGSLTNCKLAGKFAENVLGCQVREFMDMHIDKRGELKWRLLMERCAVRVVVMEGPLVSILACTISDPNEVVIKLPVY